MVKMLYNIGLTLIIMTLFQPKPKPNENVGLRTTIQVETHSVGIVTFNQNG